MNTANPELTETFLWSMILIILFILSVIQNIRYLIHSKDEYYSDYRSTCDISKADFERKYLAKRIATGIAPIIFLILFIVLF